MTCRLCGKSLTFNEVGLNKKYNAGEKDGELCMNCLAQKLGVTPRRLQEKIAEFLSIGCQLFVKDE